LVGADDGSFVGENPLLDGTTIDVEVDDAALGAIVAGDPLICNVSGACVGDPGHVMYGTDFKRS